MSFELIALFETKQGYKIVLGRVTLSNSGTAAADISASIKVPQLNYVIDVLGVVREDKNNTNVNVTKGTDTNEITVTAESVPAGETTKVKITVLGY